METMQEASSVNINTSELPPHTVLQMPALSPTTNQGNIAKWISYVFAFCACCRLRLVMLFVKSTLEFECLEEGFLAKILAPEGSRDVAAGQPIAITVSS
ncbi:Pyruvate dehydrogenase complex component E2 1 [Salvia divinorum]|uniref:Pyruvate dehydrogenase complex component E2 1 n=1 Tax=Salvia divinorum TaxID=28513 RepID=A0ABD1HB95_SALDI